MTVEQARSYIERLYDEYVSNHIRVQAREELISKINSLDSDVKGYHGREILELLQNADDAYQKSIDGGNKPENVLTVHIKYMNGCLEVMNTGTVFDTDGIKAVVQGNNSPKTGGYIGNKGTGFRSVLNWSDHIEITSGPFGVRFSKEYADAVFKQYESYEQIAKQKRKKPNLYFPILDIPQFKDGHEYVDKTTITVHLDEERIKDDFSVEKQLAEIDLRILLFLPNITEIKIETLSGETLYKRDAQNRGHLEKIVNGEIERVEDYRIFAKTIDSTVEKDKKISLAVAIPLKESEHEVQGLYTYFPLLNTQCPFNCLMHATYSLGSDRNTILRNEANKEIINGQMEFLLEIAQKLPRKDAVALLTPCGFKNSCDLPCMASFDAFNVKEQFFDKLKELKILPTVNGEGISVEDGPKIIDGSFPRLFCGEPFESLLSCELSEGSLRFIKALCEKYRKDTRMSDEKLAQKINILSKNWGPSERVEAFVWWNENKSRATLPELLEHEGGGFVTYGSECYLLEGDFDGVQPPQWVKVPSLKREYQVLLFNAARENPDVRRIKDSGENKSGQISRIISSNNIYATVNFKYRDRSTVIQAVNSSVCGVYDRAVEFVLWLWKHYRKEADWTPPRETYHFPSRDGDVCDSDKMFFGKEYGADREEKLFSDKYSALAKLPIDKDELDDFMAFLELFEVSRFPKIAPCELLATIPSYEGRIKDYISTNHGTDKKKITRIRGEFKYIDGIEDTLKRLTTAEIIWWIQNHGELFATLCKRYEHGGAVSVSYTVRTERTCRISELESYILFIFNETEWISIDGKRVCPRKALRAMRSNQAFSQLVPVISAEQMKDLSEESGVSIPEIERIFDLFDFCERVTDLSSQDFYGLLLDIPERYSVSMGAPLFKSIYGIVENPEFTKEEYEESANKKDILNKVNSWLCMRVS